MGNICSLKTEPTVASSGEVWPGCFPEIVFGVLRPKIRDLHRASPPGFATPREAANPGNNHAVQPAAQHNLGIIPLHWKAHATIVQ